MKWRFRDEFGDVRQFCCESTNIECFCAGKYFYSFRICDDSPDEGFNVCRNAEPYATTKELLEEMLIWEPKAFILMCDEEGGCTTIFDNIKEGTVEKNFSYVVEHSPWIFNWNSGHQTRILTIRLTDLGNRWSPECECCECCGCTCGLRDEN